MTKGVVMWREVVLAAVVVVLGGCSGGETSETNRPEAGRPETGRPVTTDPVITSITCTTNQWSSGIFDHFSNGGGAPTPEAAVRRWADGDEIVVADKGPTSAVVWVLREDGTAHTRLELRRFTDGTWIMETSEACAGRGENPGPGA